MQDIIVLTKKKSGYMIILSESTRTHNDLKPGGSFMKKIALGVLFFLMVCSFAFADSQYTLADDEDNYYVSRNNDNLWYVFSKHGAGLTQVWSESPVELIFDFGSHPCWFMLVYLHQNAETKRSQTEYYYPQAGVDNNFENFVINEAVHDDEDLPFTMIEYSFKFDQPELSSGEDNTLVTLYYTIGDVWPMDGLAVNIAVTNEAPSDDENIRRLMEVHCPFVRFPKIGVSSGDDVLTMGNFLLKDPIDNLALTVEPWAISDGGSWVQANRNYPDGFPVWAYYDRAENPGRGIYFATYNTDRVACQNNIYKHTGGYDDWEYIGPESNQPSGDFQNYVLWDVVRYTEDIDGEINDYPSDPEFCTFLKFYPGGLDWHNSAKRYRESTRAIDENSPCSANCEGVYTFFSQRSADINLWPDYGNVKDNPWIPDWAKYHPLMVYISPQAGTSDHDMMQNEFGVLDRVRDYQVRLADYLNVFKHLGKDTNNLPFSTWISEWSYEDPPPPESTVASYNDKYWNHPEWAGGYMPVDSSPDDYETGVDWKDKFIRNNIDEFITALQTPMPSEAKFVAHIGGFLIHDGYSENHLMANNSKLRSEYWHVSWPYNAYERSKLVDHLMGPPDPNNPQRRIPRYQGNLWGAEHPNGYHLDIPYLGGVNPRYNPADWFGMDFNCGTMPQPLNDQFPEYGLDYGYIDSVIHGNERCLNASGVYTAIGGSVPFHPNYVGFNGLGVFTGFQQHWQTLDQLYPGGGNTIYVAEREILNHFRDPEVYGDKITLNEGLGDCFLEYYDVVRHESWPAFRFVDTKKGGAMNVPTRMLINNPVDDPLPVEWAPITQVIAHDLVILQDGMNAFAPDLYWHHELDDCGKIQWTFYGGSEGASKEEKWAAYNAEMAYTYTFGSRMALMDVDVGTNVLGHELEPGDDEPNITVNLLDETDANDLSIGLGTIPYLLDILASYKNIGFPSRSDKLAEALFFGRLLKTPGFSQCSLADLFTINLKYDLNSSNHDGCGTNHFDLNVNSPSVLHSYWKFNIDDPENPDDDRLALVFSNFTKNAFWVTTNEIFLPKNFPIEPGKVYRWYDYERSQPSGSFLTMNEIDDPAHFVIHKQILQFSSKAIGIIRTDPALPLGPYAMIDNDDNLDLIIHDGVPGNLSVVFGDGSLDYPPGSAVLVAGSVYDFDAGYFTGREAYDLVYITNKSVVIVSVDETGQLTYHTTALQSRIWANTLAPGDINGDGILDVVVGTSVGCQIFTNTGTGDLTLHTVLGSQNTKALALGDLDADGTPEIVTGTPSGENTLWSNDGTGNYTDSGQLIDASNDGGIYIEDVNEDDCPDIVMVDSSGNETVYYNDCYGYFSDIPPTPSPSPTPSFTPTPGPTGTPDLSTPTPLPTETPYPGPDFYVDVNSGNDSTGDGSPETPWQTVTYAISAVHGSPFNPMTIHLSEGVYDEGQIITDPWESICGEGADLTTLSSNAAWGTILTNAGTTLENVSVINGVSDAVNLRFDSVVRHCTVTSGSVAVYVSQATNPIFEANTIILNENHTGIECWDAADLLVIDNIIVGNGVHGILVQNNSGIDIFNNIISNNVQNGITSQSTGNVSISFNTIYTNGSDGIQCVLGTPYIANNIIAVNGHYGINCTPDADPWLEYNNIWGNLIADYNGCVPGSGDISADPLFVTGPQGDFYLSQIAAGQSFDSLCVSAGDPVELPFGTTRTDHEPDVGMVDIGYHYMP